MEESVYVALSLIRIVTVIIFIRPNELQRIAGGLVQYTSLN